ncbi:MAG: hypothetical protein ABIT01_10025 [Thermoanaerobaculia bacterium]
MARSAFALFVLLSTACSIPSSARRTAKNLSITTQSIQAHISAFAEDQLAIDRLRLGNLQQLRHGTVAITHGVDRTLSLWDVRSIGKKERVISAETALLTAVRASSDHAAEIYRQDRAKEAEDQKALAEMKAAITIAADRFAKIATAFADLSERRSTLGDVKFLFAYGQEVSEKMKALRKETADAKAQATTAAAAAAPAPVPVP